MEIKIIINLLYEVNYNIIGRLLLFAMLLKFWSSWKTWVAFHCDYS